MATLPKGQGVLLPPFKAWLASNIPAVYDNTMTYYEELVALIKYLQDIVVPAVNNNASAVTTISEAVEQLQSYVKNYFANLDVQEEINNKLDQMAADGTLADIMAEYAATKVDYFYIDSNSTSSDILSAFASEKTKVIEFASGTYELGGDLILSSNTIVNLNGSKITRSSNQWVLGYGRDSEYTDYNGVYNVHFNNGSIELPIALMHNVDISFKNIDFLAVNDHAIQMAGCKDITIDSCVFEGRLINDTIGDHFEAVQLESATRVGQPFLNNSDSPSYDSKGNYNVRVTNCVFNSGNGTTTKMYTAIGGHSNDENNLYPAENVVIDNCTFQNVWYAQLCPCGFKHSRITNNTFTISNDTGQVQNIRFRYFNDSILIENNTFVGGVQNITNVNSNGYCNGLQVINNTFDSEFTNNLCNVLIANWTNVLIKDNVFKHAKNYNVYVGQNTTYYATDVKLVGNYFKVDNLSSTGGNVYIRYATGVELYDNTFVKPVNYVSGRYSLQVASGTATGLSYANNNIKGTGGIFQSGISDYTNIYGLQALTYLTDDSEYQALTNVSPTYAFDQFDRLTLVVHKNQDPDHTMFCYVESYSVGGKVYLDKSYSFQVTDGTNSGIITFTINADGTFSYTSANSFTLRRIYASNN